MKKDLRTKNFLIFFLFLTLGIILTENLLYAEYCIPENVVLNSPTIKAVYYNDRCYLNYSGMQNSGPGTTKYCYKRNESFPSSKIENGICYYDATSFAEDFCEDDQCRPTFGCTYLNHDRPPEIHISLSNSRIVKSSEQLSISVNLYTDDPVNISVCKDNLCNSVITSTQKMGSTSFSINIYPKDVCRDEYVGVCILYVYVQEIEQDPCGFRKNQTKSLSFFVYPQNGIYISLLEYLSAILPELSKKKVGKEAGLYICEKYVELCISSGFGCNDADACDASIYEFVGDNIRINCTDTWWGCVFPNKKQRIVEFSDVYKYFETSLNLKSYCYAGKVDLTGDYPDWDNYRDWDGFEDQTLIGWIFVHIDSNKTCCTNAGGTFVDLPKNGGGSGQFCCKVSEYWTAHNGSQEGVTISDEKIINCSLCNSGSVSYFTLYGNNYYNPHSNVCYHGQISCAPLNIANGTANLAPRTPVDVIYQLLVSGSVKKIQVSANISDPENDQILLIVTNSTGAQLCNSSSTSGGRVSCDFQLTALCSSSDFTKNINIFASEKNNDQCGVRKNSSIVELTIPCDFTPPQNSYSILETNAYYNSTLKRYFANAGKRFVIQVNSTDDHKMKELTFILADERCSDVYSCENSIRIKYNETNVLYEKSHPLFNIVKVDSYKSADNKTFSMNITLDILVHKTETPINFTILVNGTEWIENSNLTQFIDRKITIFNGGHTINEENSFKIESIESTKENSNINVNVNIISPLELVRTELHYAVSDLLRDNSCSAMYSSWMKSSSNTQLSTTGFSNKCIKLRYFAEDIAGNIVFKEDSKIWKIK